MGVIKHKYHPMLQWNIDNQAPFTYFTTHVI